MNNFEGDVGQAELVDRAMRSFDKASGQDFVGLEISFCFVQHRFHIIICAANAQAVWVWGGCNFKKVVWESRPHHNVSSTATSRGYLRIK